MSNKQIYDTVFRHYFNDKERFLSLGNATLNTNIDDAEKIHFNTLKGTFYSNLKNDISCLFGEYFLFITEHQSTVNENMTFRFLCYAVELYQKYVAENKLKMYRKSIVKLPIPRFVIFYDGEEKEYEYRQLRLSDAFGGNGEYLELCADMYNLQGGMNEELKEKCPYLRQYSMFSAKHRALRKKGMSVDEATKETIAYCRDNNIMSDYIAEHESEVFRMLTMEWNENEAKNAYIEEGIEQGMKQGFLSAMNEIALKMLSKNKTIDEIADCISLSREQIKRIARANNLPVTE